MYTNFLVLHVIVFDDGANFKGVPGSPSDGSQSAAWGQVTENEGLLGKNVGRIVWRIT